MERWLLFESNISRYVAFVVCDVSMAQYRWVVMAPTANRKGPQKA